MLKRSRSESNVEQEIDHNHEQNKSTRLKQFTEKTPEFNELLTSHFGDFGELVDVKYGEEDLKHITNVSYKTSNGEVKTVPLTFSMQQLKDGTKLPMLTEVEDVMDPNNGSEMIDRNYHVTMKLGSKSPSKKTLRYSFDMHTTELEYTPKRAFLGFQSQDMPYDLEELDGKHPKLMLVNDKGRPTGDGTEIAEWVQLTQGDRQKQRNVTKPSLIFQNMVEHQQGKLGLPSYVTSEEDRQRREAYLQTYRNFTMDAPKQFQKLTENQKLDQADKLSKMLSTMYKDTNYEGLSQFSPEQWKKYMHLNQWIDRKGQITVLGTQGIFAVEMSQQYSHDLGDRALRWYKKELKESSVSDKQLKNIETLPREKQLELMSTLEEGQGRFIDLKGKERFGGWAKSQRTIRSVTGTVKDNKTLDKVIDDNVKTLGPKKELPKQRNVTSPNLEH